MGGEGERVGRDACEAQSGAEPDMTEANCEPGEDCAEAGEREQPVEDLGLSVGGED
jgi:hypothetical protein